MKYKDFIIETFRNGYCQRFIIQAKNITEAFKIAKNDYDLNVNINGLGDTYFVF